MLKTTVAFICCFFSLSGPLRAETVEEIKAAMRSGCNFALQEKAECEINKECHSLEGEFLKWQSCEEDCQRRAKAASEYNEFVRECRRQLEKTEQQNLDRDSVTLGFGTIHVPVAYGLSWLQPVPASASAA